MATKKKEAPDKVLVQETREIELPGQPDVPAGKLAFRMVYSDGQHRDIIGDSRFDCTSRAIKQARDDKKNFASADIMKFDRIA